MPGKAPPYGSGLAASEDDAKRFHAALSLHYLADPHAGLHRPSRWVAIALNPVSSDNTLYDSLAEAITHQGPDPNKFAYMRLPPACPSVRECASLLGYFRRRYDAGWRPAGVHEGRELILPTRVEAMEL